MKSLVIDSAASCMVIAAKNENLTATLSLDIGMKQSQKILPAIDYVLEQVGISSSELDFTALTSGPGTFTGLRLAFSALKAIELAHEVPIYGIPSLDAYAYPFREFGEVVVSVIDAKKNQFFAAVYKNGECIFPAEDTTAEKISAFLKSTLENGEKIIVVGPDAKIFSGELKENGIENAKFLSSQPNATDSLSEIAESMIEQKKEPLKDYDGPIYLRKSEAEIALENK
ncbi:MAG: tRNA (adenosine(37)-N6)-threonylcarbamoyltransferase complex dimerization subunit type 1 TsaB [Treponema sp.]|nr:tRNA (adenosine(37)-N6)-threonylcarbamoyltransferase complex dimerization subunit type 1 TsaB [Treponema sp.]